MYLSFYHLKHKPFQISTDPRFLWLGEKHEEALATLRYGVIDSKGFLLLTGDVGTGKTTLINALLRTLDKDTFVAFIRDPALDPLDFFQYTAHAFGMRADRINSKGSFLIQFEQFLLDAYEKRRRVLLIIDEAQRMSQELLEEVRLLSNIEREDSKLLNIFFIGQIEFNEIIHRPENRAIRQRITINYNIEELSEEETRQYIKHRIDVASSKEDIGFFAPVHKKENGEYVMQGLRLPLPEVQEEIFTVDAAKEVYAFSKGYPRLINIICDRALLTGYVEGAKVITLKHVRECVKELEIPHIKGKKSHSERPQTSLKNSLEELNREFEELRKQETLKQKKSEDTPRELIHRLEKAENVHDDLAEDNPPRQVDPPQSKPAPEEYIPEEPKDPPSTAKAMALDSNEEVIVDEPEQDSEFLEITEEDLAEEAAQDFVEQEEIDDISEEEVEQEVYIGSTPERPLIRSDKKKSGSGIKNLVFVSGLLCLGFLAYLGFSSTENESEIKDAVQPVSSLDKAQSQDEEPIKIHPLEQSDPVSTTPSEVSDNGNATTDSSTGNKEEPKEEVAPPTLKKEGIAKKPVPENPTKKPATHSSTKPAEIKAKKPAKKAVEKIAKKPDVKLDVKPDDKVAENKSTKKAPPNQTTQVIKAREKNKKSPTISEKINQLKSLITFEKITISYPDNTGMPPAETRSKLNDLVDSLMTHSSFKVEVSYEAAVKSNAGKSDKTSEIRAQRLKSYFMQRGLEENRIIMTGKQQLRGSKSADGKSVINQIVQVDVKR